MIHGNYKKSRHLFSSTITYRNKPELNHFYSLTIIHYSAEYTQEMLFRHVLATTVFLFLCCIFLEVFFFCASGWLRVHIAEEKLKWQTDFLLRCGYGGVCVWVRVTGKTQTKTGRERATEQDTKMTGCWFQSHSFQLFRFPACPGDCLYPTCCYRNSSKENWNMSMPPLSFLRASCSHLIIHNPVNSRVTQERLPPNLEFLRIYQLNSVEIKNRMLWLDDRLYKIWQEAVNALELPDYVKGLGIFFKED